MRLAVSPNVPTSASRLVPSLRYRDVEAAIEWLCRAFGFVEHDVVSAPDGTIRHAQLILGSDMIVLLPAWPSQSDGTGAQTDESGRLGAQSLYFVVDDAEEHYHRAAAAGATLLENGQFAFGGHGYSCRDPEGHVWHFGTHNPRGEETTDGVWIRDFLYGNRAADFAAGLRDKLNPAVLVAGAAAVIVAAIVWILVALPQTNARERGLAFRAAVAPRHNDENAPRVLARAGERPQAKASPQTSELPAEAVRPGGPAFASIDASQADRTIEEAPGKMRAARQAVERGVEATGLRTATQAFRQMRAARRAAAITQPRPVETRDQLAAVSPAAPAPEQKPARERAAKEIPAAKKDVPAKAHVKDADAKATGERTGKDARNAAAEGEWQTRATTPAAQPVKVLARPAKEPNADQGWDCESSQPSGQFICHPVGKKPAAAKAAATQPFETREEPRRTQEQQGAGAPIWDCQPTPPDGQVQCRPMAGAGPQR